MLLIYTLGANAINSSKKSTIFYSQKNDLFLLYFITKFVCCVLREGKNKDETKSCENDLKGRMQAMLVYTDSLTKTEQNLYTYMW